MDTIKRVITTNEFQFTHPGGVRQQNAVYFQYIQGVFQFTHPGGVRLTKSKLFLNLFNVSIHAPGRGATSHMR